ncbi:MULTISPECIES: L-lactate permease [unclassified Gemella]|uniref:L-lactate permease n=1 Tax=unclassified Gemella TaxID=2624949 RepID=UPI001D16C4CE|nr:MULTISPECIES: L-lactate permease [unclassified Gemella]
MNCPADISNHSLSCAPVNLIIAATLSYKYRSATFLIARDPFLISVYAVESSLAPALKGAAGPLNSLIYKFEYFNMHEAIASVAPVVEKTTPIKAIFTFAPFTHTTSAILLAAIVTILLFRVKSSIVKEVVSETFKELYAPILTICSVLALAKIATYSGMSSTLGLAFANTGAVFPLLSPILGWIGVFLTGSVVNAGSLFAGLQSVTASQLGIDPSLLVAANVMGGAIAKMISPQSIVVAAAAVGLVNQDSKIFAKTVKISIVILALVCIANFFVTR